MADDLTTSDAWVPPHPVARDDVTEMLHGAYDLHVHSGPDRRPRRYDALDLMRGYAAAGMAGAVVKDHFLPTVGRTHLLNRLLPEFRSFSTCVLNASIGGLNPAAVESALDAGVRYFIMPTVSAAHYRRYEGHPPLDAGSWPDITVLDGQDRLTPATSAVLDALQGHDVVLASGHLSPHETRVLFREAHSRGLRRLVVTHASIDFIDMPMEIQRELAALGAVIEHAYVSALFNRPVGLDRMWYQMRELGLGSCYLASDLGQPHNPAPLDGWRAALGGLLALGATKDDVAQLVRDTPGGVVDGLPKFAGSWIPDGWTPDGEAPATGARS